MGSLIEGGTRVVTSPDAGIAPTSRTMCFPQAIADMAESLGNAGGLPASTHRAGAARNLAGRKGRLPPGFDADLLIVDGYPSPTSPPPHRPFHRGHTRHHQPAAHA